MRIAFDAKTWESGKAAETAALPVWEKNQLTPTGRALDKKTKGAITRAMKAAGFTGARGSFADILVPEGLGIGRLICAGLGKKKDFTSRRAEKMGGAIVRRLAPSSPKKLVILLKELETGKESAASAAAHLALGARLGSYRFDAYRTKLKPKEKGKVGEIVIMSDDPAGAKRLFADMERIAEGVALARDLVNEPPNILYPESFAKRAQELAKKGVAVKTLNEAQMKKLNMNALLGVGQGSVRESRLVSMHWKGGGEKDPAIAIVGKGVCFDTGGISIKPAGGMGDMKGDMGGAACVVGLIHALAARKARLNVIGVIGLVENMPGGNAQRPGDIVRSMSGKTIEILNTDAEGRLVLADALAYAQKTFKPDILIDLATLTGAILVALGQDRAGLFSNDDKLAAHLHQAGEESGEKVWRLPLGRAYDKMIDSKVADVKNIGGGRYAGSITAAQFLQRFVGKGMRWAHLDIAGTAFASPQSPINPSWGSGFGVRLLHRFLQTRFEKNAAPDGKRTS